MPCWLCSMLPSLLHRQFTYRTLPWRRSTKLVPTTMDAACAAGAFADPPSRPDVAIPAPHRALNSTQDIPGSMLCDRCFPSERAVAICSELIHDDVSGDES